MLRTICHLGSSNLRLAVEPKRQIELLLFEVLPLMAYDAHGFRARAVHTDRPTLATAAYMDWSAELRRLHELRHGREVLLHWCQACEILHFPPHFDRMPELPGICRRCESQRVWPRTVLAVRPVGGGFQFPWIGTYTKRSVLVEAGMHPQLAWARVSSCAERLTQAEVLQAWSGLRCGAEPRGGSHCSAGGAGQPLLASGDDL